MKIKFSKMHGLGNDFVIINNLEYQHQFQPSEIQFLADRKFGIGCDQVLIIDESTDEISDFFYRIFNADGSIAGQCGNGARCFIKYIVANSLTNKKYIQLQTLDRVINGQVLAENIIEVDMGAPVFSPEEIPLNMHLVARYSFKVADKEISFGAVSMGNPHAVIYLNSQAKLSDDSYLYEIGKAFQSSEYFPESVNVNFVYIENNQTIHLRTYERGCGFTLACGSGACASAAVAIKDGLIDSVVNVLMPGGQLKILWNKSENLFMQGSATQVFDGQIIL